jgi:hypothetical protein
VNFTIKTLENHYFKRIIQILFPIQHIEFAVAITLEDQRDVFNKVLTNNFSIMAADNVICNLAL